MNRNCFKDTLDNWKAKAKSTPHRSHRLPLSLLRLEEANHDCITWSFNYSAFKDAVCNLQLEHLNCFCGCTEDKQKNKTSDRD